MQSVNFEFIRDKAPALADFGGFAETYLDTDPDSALTKLRNFAEIAVKELYRSRGWHPPETFSLDKLLQEREFSETWPKAVIYKLDYLRIHGNKGAHGAQKSSVEARAVLKEAFNIAQWMHLTLYEGAENEPPTYQDIDKNIKKAKQSEAALIDAQIKHESDLQKLMKQLQEEQKKNHYLMQQKLMVEKKESFETIQSHNMLESIHDNESSMELSNDLFDIPAFLRSEDDEFDEMVSFMQSTEYVPIQGQEQADHLGFSDADAQAQIIQLYLARAGWDVQDTDQVKCYQLDSKVAGDHQSTVYRLNDEFTQPLAIIGVLSEVSNPDSDMFDELRIHADSLLDDQSVQPAIFATNGYEIYLWDGHAVQDSPPRKIYGFYSKQSLEYLLWQRKHREKLDLNKLDSSILGDRAYQHESLSVVCDAFNEGRRKSLLVQATGTGKTRLAVALADVIMKSNCGKRILFLCDRRELRKQAKNTFNEFLSAPSIYLTKESVEDKTNQLFFATYPAMIKLYQRFDVGFFDLIIADESHRSIYNVYGDLFRYFDSLQIGLTATPVEMVSRSTCRLFDCEFKKPTVNYSLEEAIDEKFLVPYQVVKHTTKFMREGINESVLSPEQIRELEDQGQDPEQIDFDAEQIDKLIHNKDTNRRILRNLMDQGLRGPDQQTLGKTIIFARNHRHAKMLEDLFNEMYPQFGRQFCRVIDIYDGHAEALIDEFKDSSRSDLTIAISVDMLDTGIDVPEVLNLVIAKPVRSPVKFWQMLGRGTRLRKDLFGSGKDKTHFQIFDHWGVVEDHALRQREVVVSQSKPLGQKLLETRVELAKTSRQKSKSELFDTVIQLIHGMICQLDNDVITVRDHWRTKKAMENIETLKEFSQQTIDLLLAEMAPVMKELDLREHVEAYQWDLLLSQIMDARLQESGRATDLVGEANRRVLALQRTINQVRAKEKWVISLSELSWWTSASIDQLEEARREMRDIMRFHAIERSSTPPLETDIEDSGEQSEKQKTHLLAVDLMNYQALVQKTLSDLLDTNPTIKKIRCEDSVTEHEIKALNAVVREKNKDIDLDTLRSFYSKETTMEQLLRSIIGRDEDAVDATFTDFKRRYPSLNARQSQFIRAVQREVIRLGALNISDLYSGQFSNIGNLDDLFIHDDQIDAILELVEGFGLPPERVKQE